MLIFYGSYVA